MTRIGLKPISLPSGVELVFGEGVIVVKGPKGEVSVHVPAGVSVEVKDGAAHVKSNAVNEAEAEALAAVHGTTAALLHAAVHGVTEGWKKELEVNGTGYRASMKGNKVTMFLGYSHQVEVEPVGKYTKISCPDETHIVVEGCSKEDVGQTAALIYNKHKPDVYGQKGVHYKGQQLIKKVGKRAAGGKK